MKGNFKINPGIKLIILTYYQHINYQQEKNGNFINSKYTISIIIIIIYGGDE